MTEPDSPTPSQFLRAIPFWRRIKVRIVIAMGLTVFLVAGSLFVTGLLLRRDSLLRQFQDYVTTVAGTGAVAINGDDLEYIEFLPDYVTPEFQSVRKILDTIRQRNGLTEDEIYLLRPVDASDPYLAEFVVMVHEQPFIGNRYEIRQENREAYDTTRRLGIPSQTGIYEDQHGTWISAYAPIYNSAGSIVAVIEVDSEISRYFTALMREFYVEAVVTLLAFGVALIPVYFFGGRLAHGIGQVARAIQKFESGNLDVRLGLSTKDEVQAIGDTFDRMAKSISERLELLPYVPTFTRRAVRRRQIDEGRWDRTRHKNVVMLFSDVRGFTGSTRHQPPDAVVHRLNRLLSIQTEVITEFGGEVDKFMGDGVMAVFMEMDDAAEKATACGRELINRLRQELAQAQDGWALGIGLDSGVALLGAIGADDRKDFTLIGFPVNHAAHLCGKARPWEMLVSPRVHRALVPAQQAWFWEAFELAAKAGREPETVHSYRRDTVTRTPWR